MALAFMAQGLWPKAHGSTFGSRHNALGPQNRVTRTPPARGRGVKGYLVEPLGAKWPPKADKEDPKADTERPKVAKARPDIDHKAPSSEKSRKKLSEAFSGAAPNHEKAWFSLGFCVFR